MPLQFINPNCIVGYNLTMRFKKENIMKKQFWIAGVIASSVLSLGSFIPFSNNEKDYLDVQLIKLIRNSSSDNAIESFKLPRNLKDTQMDELNYINEAKIELGKELFFNKGWSINTKRPDMIGTVSCASCHKLQFGFKAGVRQAIGEGGIEQEERIIVNKAYSKEDIDRQNIATPTIINVASQVVLGWTGQFSGVGANKNLLPSPHIGTILHKINQLGYEGTISQALAAQHTHRLAMNQETAENLNIAQLFDKAFPDVPKSERYTAKSVAFALDAYQRNVISNQAPLQDWLYGDYNALSDSEKRGAILFFGKAGCSSCHNNNALSGDKFYAVGMSNLSDNNHSSVVITVANPSEDSGRFMTTCESKDRNKFKVPQLYNIKDYIFLGMVVVFRLLEK